MKKNIKTIAEVVARTIARHQARERLPRADIDLISVERLETPLTGDRVTDRWNNNFNTVGS